MQCNKEFESESKCESDAEGKVVRIGHALKVDTDHHRLMEPSRNTEHMLRDAHAKIINIFQISDLRQRRKARQEHKVAQQVACAMQEGIRVRVLMRIRRK